MTPFFTTPEQYTRVNAIALTWEKTPYVPDGAVKGTGCSCSMLPYSILKEAGFELPEPPKRGKMLRCELLGVMLGWLMAQEGKHLERVSDIKDAKPGDILLFDAGTGHLAICIEGRYALHSWQNQGAHITNFHDDKTLRRLVGIWRPSVA